MRPSALIVEDDPNTRELLKKLVEQEEFGVVDTAADGARAIELLEKQDYNCIVLDIVLPKVSGTGVMDHLRRTNPSMLENVIVVTGVDVKDIQRLYPVCHTVGKPVMPSRLRSWVRKCISDESGKRPAVAATIRGTTQG